VNKLAKSHKKAGMLYLVLFVFLIGAIILAISSKTFQKVNYPLKYKEDVIKFSAQNRIDPYLVFAIIKAESGFNPNALSKRKAMGLMQLTEGTAEWGAAKLKLKNFIIDDLYKPEINIQIGCWYIAQLMKEYTDKDPDLVIVAYNGGSGNVNSWLKDKNFSSTGYKLDRIPFKETDNFLKKVRSYYNKYSWLYGTD
jgi:soluble lytic murein transglycosylase